MKSCFSDMAVKLLVSFSIFNPTMLPSEEEERFSQYGKEEIEALAQFYGSEATVSYDGETYTSHPLHDKDDLIGEWQVFKRANGKKENYGSGTYVGGQGAHGVYWSIHRIVPETFKLLNIILVLPVGTVSVERSFSSMNW